MIKIGIVGYGYWGPNLLRNFSQLDNVEVTTIVDLDTSRFKLLNKQYPQIKCIDSFKELIEDEKIQAVVIATPAATHYKLVRLALLADKHVLVEKPYVLNSKEAVEIKKIAKSMQKVLMVDHTFIYSSSVIKIKKYLEEKNIGKIKYIDATRINLGLFQSDINVLWDLAPHDLSIIFYLFNKEKLKTVQAIGVSHLKNSIEDVAYLILKFKSGLIAHLNCSWYSPVKVRTMLFGGDRKMIIWNDLEPTEKIKIYNKGIFVKNTKSKKNVMQIGYRQGDIFIPYIENYEALSGMAQDFINSIVKFKKPESDTEIALRVVRVLELAQISIKSKGKEMQFSNA